MKFDLHCHTKGGKAVDLEQIFDYNRALNYLESMVNQ